MTLVRTTTRIGTVVFVALWGLAVAAAQTTTASAPSSQPTSAPGERTPIKARVLEVRGDVQHAPLDSEDWQPCKVDDEYPPETMIRTGLRSSAKLQIGQDDTYTAVVIEAASKTLLSEAYTTADSKHVNIGVGYGQIRAGVAEGGLKSDFTVSSPVATLSKRGTWNFGLFYERGTDRFEIFLLDYGLVDAFSKVTGERRQLLPRELVTQIMRRWLDESQMHRTVPVSDVLGQSDIEVAFNALQQSGLRVIDPQGGQAVLIDLSSAYSQQEFATLAQQVLGTLPPRTIISGPRLRTEGFFGTGRGADLIPVIIDATSPLAQKGLARPGTYKFSRPALEGWLRQHNGR